MRAAPLACIAAQTDPGLNHLPLLTVADTATHTAARTVGPFSASIRPFTVNGRQTLCFVNVNACLGFEVGDITTGKKLHRVEVQGVAPGPVKRHGCPSHGIGLTPDEREVWVVDAFNRKVHVFDPKTGENLTRDAEAGRRLTEEAAEDRIEQVERAKV